MHETCSIYFCVERDVKCVWRKPHSEMGARMCVCEGATLKFAVCLRQVVNHSVQSPPKTPGLLPRMGLTGSHLQLEVPRTQEAADPLPSRWDVPALGWRSQLVIGWTTWELTASFVFLTRWTEQGWRCGGGNGTLGNPAYSHSILSLMEVWLGKRSLNGSQNPSQPYPRVPEPTKSNLLVLVSPAL